MQRVVVVGLERSVAELIQSMRREPHAGLEIAAVCIDRPRSDYVGNVYPQPDGRLNRNGVLDVARAVDKLHRHASTLVTALPR